jgi:hypothetical protein
MTERERTPSIIALEKDTLKDPTTEKSCFFRMTMRYFSVSQFLTFILILKLARFGLML